MGGDEGCWVCRVLKREEKDGKKEEEEVGKKYFYLSNFSSLGDNKFCLICIFRFNCNLWDGRRNGKRAENFHPHLVLKN